MDELRQFEAAMLERGVFIPEDLLQGCFYVHLELQKMAGLMRTNRGPHNEPASAFLVSSLIPPDC